MSHLESEIGTVKLVQNGQSLAFKLSKKDCDLMKIDSMTEFEKVISPDGNEITFRKVAPGERNILAVANQVYDQHADLMKRLEKL
ncbi:AbrB family transcriptional regulator [Lactiplantibacillus nangangensis]|uniref:AbrB family transcriptional regulator n=1 Tax=Lactiplantibacillus nangangensis TaxID=2559917 RepID=A0ABW1SN64_9LACO|nr:AbrB family transcriptional regulator [Lactiplantibacillus nangangensis]